MAFIRRPLPHKAHRQLVRNVPKCTQERYDTILIGSGLSTLSTAALLHRYNGSHKTIILEAHTTLGGAAHPFRRSCQDGVITFECGPHLFSGLHAQDGNPVGELFRALDIQPKVKSYNSWGVFLGERYYKTRIPSDILLGEVLTPKGRVEMQRLTNAILPYGKAAKALSIACLRGDIGVLWTILPRLPRLMKHARYLVDVSKPLSWLLKKVVSDRLTYNMVDLICFLLAGVGAEGIPLAEAGYMFHEWCSGDVDGVLQRPVGGGYGIVQALVEYIEQHGGVVKTGMKVEKILFDEKGVTSGVGLKNGVIVKGKRVISGISGLDHDRLIGKSGVREREVCDSFIHVHHAFRVEELGVGIGELQVNYVVVDDIYGDITKPGNVVLVSIPSVIDDVAPDGWVVLHAYTPATEPWEIWETLEEGSEAYERYKNIRAEAVWNALHKIFGKDLRNVGLSLVGSPKTHARYLHRERGSYGARVDAKAGWSFGLDLCGGDNGVWRCGDGVFPGIGVPAVVGSAWIVANSCVDVGKHVQLLRDLGI